MGSKFVDVDSIDVAQRFGVVLWEYMAIFMAIAWTAAGPSCNVGISIPTLQDAVV